MCFVTPLRKTHIDRSTLMSRNIKLSATKSLTVVDIPATAENFRRLCREHNTPPNVICSKLHLSSVQSVYHWLSGRSMPTIDNLVLLSDLWNVNIDEIIRTVKVNTSKDEDDGK